MLPRFMRAVGLSGFSSRDLSAKAKLYYCCKVFVGAQFIRAVGLSGISSRDLR